MIPLWSVLGLIAVVLILQALTAFRLARLRRARVYPEAGKATMSDVQRLLQNGRTDWAIRCYREVHACSLRQAKEAITMLLNESPPAAS